MATSFRTGYKIPIHFAPRKQLMSVSGINSKLADVIFQLRRQGVVITKEVLTNFRDKNTPSEPMFSKTSLESFNYSCKREDFPEYFRSHQYERDGRAGSGTNHGQQRGSRYQNRNWKSKSGNQDNCNCIYLFKMVLNQLQKCHDSQRHSCSDYQSSHHSTNRDNNFKHSSRKANSQSKKATDFQLDDERPVEIR